MSKFLITRGRKFSITTSPIATKSRNIALPLGLSNLNERFNLFLFNLSVTLPSRLKGILGSLTFITSAPKSAKVRVPSGPAQTLVRSITLRLRKAPDCFSVFSDVMSGLANICICVFP